MNYKAHYDQSWFRPLPSLPILIAIATTTQETHDTFRSLIHMMTTIDPGLLQITDEQRDLIYKIEAITVAMPP
jgi:hypothetical protein